MKVLQIVHGFPPECSGGTESYVLQLCRELIAQGHEVDVLCGSHEGAGPGAAEPRLVHSRHEGIRVHRLHRTGLFVDNWEKSLAPEIEPLLDFILRDLAPDLVHVHHWIRLSRNLVEACHDRGIPAVATLHDLWTTCPKAFRIRDNTFCGLEPGPVNCLGCAPAGEFMDDEEQRRELALFRDDFRNELELARRLIVPTAAHRDVLLRHHPTLQGKFRVIPHGNISPIRRRRPGRGAFPGGPLRVGHWGHLSFLKGLDILLEGIRHSRRQDDIELEVFGEVVYPQEKPRVEELSRGLAITWHGRYEPRDLAQVQLDLAVIPTRCSESWSFVLDEAFLLGLPVLVPERGALAERLDGAGSTFLADDARDLGRILAGVFSNPAIIDAWRSRIPALPSFKNHGEAMERLYREVRSSTAPLPVTPRGLRTHRLQVKAWQLEARNRRMEDSHGQVENLQADLKRAAATMADMDFYHREKDKELARLAAEVERLSAAVDVARQGSESLVRDSAERLTREIEEARRSGAAEAEATAQRQLRALEKKDRKKQRRVERLRERLVAERAEVRSAREGLDLVLARLEAGGAGAAARSTDVQDARAAGDRLRDLISSTLDQLAASEAARRQVGQDLERARDAERLLRAEAGAAHERLLRGREGERRRDLAIAEARRSAAEKAAEAESARARVATLRAQVAGVEQRLAGLLAERASAAAWREYHESHLETVVESLERKRTIVADLRAEIEKERSVSEALRAEGAAARARLDAARDREAALVTRLRGAAPASPAPGAGPVGHEPAELDREIDGLLGRTAAREESLAGMARTIDQLLQMIQTQERRRRSATPVPASRSGVPAGRRLRILFVVHQYLPRHVAGTEIYSRNLARELSQRHDVVVLTAESDHARPRFEHTVRRQDGIRVHQVIHNYAWNGFRDTYDCPEADAVFRSVLTAETPDVVHIQHLHYGSVNFVSIAKSRGIPVVFTLHDYILLCPRDGQLRRADGGICDQPVPAQCADCIRHYPLEPGVAPAVPRGLLPGADAMIPPEITRAVRSALRNGGAARSPHEDAAAERLDYIARTLRDVDLFVSPSAFLKRTFVESGMIPADRILVSDNGYDIAAFEGAARVPAANELRVAFIGTIAEHKGPHVLVDAMNGIDDPRVTCRIWGDLTAFHGYTADLRARVRNPRTFLMGPFPPERTREVLSRTDLLVVPSLWFENSPLTVHEAAMAGIPVLVTDRGGLAEYVKDGVTGLHFRLGDVDDLRRKILAFLESPGPLPGFDPRALPVKSIAEDARDMEIRYQRLLERAALPV